jgi:spermidine/putrescine transport system permease protein
MKKSRIPMITIWALLLFFYLPILVLVANAFNSSRYGGSWDGFTLHWFQRLFKEMAIWNALRNTLLIAMATTITSMLLGTAAAFALHRFRGNLQRFHYGLIYTPLVMPDILMGMSLLLFFVATGFRLGLVTIYIAHTSFCISYVAMVVLARLQDFDFTIMEAARDLGADWWTATRRVLLPLLAPGIAAGGLLAFTLSIDDFVITFFVAGPGATTLPIHIYSMIKHSRHMPMINALSTIMLAITFLGVWGHQTLANKENRI